MKKAIIYLLISFCGVITYAQNVGIGTTTPGFPLNFSSTLGDKISLYGNSGNHFGFGIQNSLLQIHTDATISNIGFGYGSSGNFTERMRIINNVGYDGMSLSGRLILKNGSTDLVGGGAGVWLYKADNTALLGFMGAQNNQNIGFFGGPAEWGFTYDAINSRVGIGNNNPNAPLAFSPSLGKKITLYPGATGDVGFGVAGNRLQIYSDNPNADVAIGYDAAGTFNERFAVKPNGALAVVGNTGATNQILASRGSSNSAQWRSMNSYIQTYSASGTANLTYQGAFLLSNPIAFNLSQPSRVMVWVDAVSDKACVFYPCPTCWQLTVRIAGQSVNTRIINAVHYDQTYRTDTRTVGPFLYNLAAGSYGITLDAFSVNSTDPTVTVYVTVMIVAE
ncbi:MAG TPA: hypothetical protein VIZ28_09375 [Chitinophagaceae bacterium]